MAVALTLLALLIEVVVGYPDRLVRAIGHPVMWMGRLISILDRTLNHESMQQCQPPRGGSRRHSDRHHRRGRRLRSSWSAACLLLPLGIVAVAIVASTLIAQRSLYDHVVRVAAALEQNGIAAGREAVSHIVGRDPEALDQAGVARAAIESLAENFSDGVVAPAFWLMVGGLPGGAAYKAINTADSMIGHRTPRHEAFGFAAARLDDLVNLPASRLSALLIVAAAAVTTGASATDAWRAVAPRRTASPLAERGLSRGGDGRRARSRACGPAQSMAVCEVEDAVMGDGRRDASAADIRAALTLYQRADAMLIGIVALLAIVVTATG